LLSSWLLCFFLFCLLSFAPCFILFFLSANGLFLFYSFVLSPPYLCFLSFWLLELDFAVRETPRCAFLYEEWAPWELGHNNIDLREESAVWESFLH
jgi:hypothetical protein